MNYKQLSLTERHYIETSLRMGETIKDISKALKRHASSVYREIKRNRGQRGYRHKQANGTAQDRHKLKPKSMKVTAFILKYISEKIKDEWSPEQISGRMLLDTGTRVHHETIYQYLLKDKKAGGDLSDHLRHKSKKYRKRYGSSKRKPGIPNRVDISERPESVNTRAEFGHWEADTIIGHGHQGAIVTIDERVSKLRLAYPINRKKAELTSLALQTILKPLKDHIHSITYDNGVEFAQHEKVAKAVECEHYFARPYHSWERGQNENANGLLRQYFPKSEPLMNVEARRVWEAVNKLNNRPRKCLGFKTPYEAFFEHTGVNIKKLIPFALMT